METEQHTCHEPCPGGQSCCLRVDIPHTLHMCNDKDCFCHEAARYSGNGHAKPAAPKPLYHFTTFARTTDA